MKSAPLALILALALAGSALAKPEPAKRKAAEVEATMPAENDGGLGPLFHASPKEVRERMGDPDVARAEGKGAFWTYRLPHCALFLFFHETARGLRVTGAATGVRKRGEPLQDVETCVASAITVGPA